jgi:transposase
MFQEEKIYIGIDVSKSVLDLFILPTKKYMRFTNDEAGIKKLIKKIQLFSDTLTVMESTGGYEASLAYALNEQGLSASVVNPRQIRDFAKALGRLAKTDQIDAEIIALFASKVEPKPQIVYSKEQALLSKNNTRRTQLIQMITMEKNRLDKASKEQSESIARVLEVLEKELGLIDSAQEQLIQEHSDFSEKSKLLESIKGVGKVTAFSILAELPELGTIGHKQIAALAGLAPFNRDSGSLKGTRAIWGGRASVRRALYMAALAATIHNPLMRQFYQRLCAAGKAKKTALIAVMRKLLITMNALVRKNQYWVEEQTALN